MPLTLLSVLQRKKRQSNTLALMLRNVDEVLAAFAQVATERELTAPEQDELASLKVRRQRIADSITEAGGASLTA